ncbi:MAG: DNA polymerase III subunit delta [Bacilli bacterium]
MIYTIQASDQLLGQEKIKRLLLKEQVTMDTMNTMQFDASSHSIDKIVEYCNTSPFFATYKIAIINNPLFLTSDSSKDFEEFNKGLIEYIENENSTTILIIFALYEKLDERKKIVKYLKEKTNFIKIEAPTHVEINKIITKLVEKHQVKIEPQAITTLIERVGSNMVDLVSEIDKLTLFKDQGTITKADFEDFIVCDIDTSIFDLSNAILDGKHGLALDYFDSLSKSGLEPIQLIVIMANQIRIALLGKAYLRLGLSQADISKKIGIHPYRLKLALNLNYDDVKLKNVMVGLGNLDYNIKIGKTNKYQGLKILILSI